MLKSSQDKQQDELEGLLAGMSEVSQLFKEGEMYVPEVLMAAKDNDREQVIYETADLWFHNLVLLTQQGIRVEEVLAELARRQGLSGLAEKAARQES